MEDIEVGSFTVVISINGDTKQVVFPLVSTIDVEGVKREMRSTYNVAGGTLSSRSHEVVVAYTLILGGVYFFIAFTPPPTQSKIAIFLGHRSCISSLFDVSVLYFLFYYSCILLPNFYFLL